jgi:alkaline phosphatase
MSNFSRRDFLKTGALSGLFAGTVLAGCSATGVNNSKGMARNVILMVSDGMSIGALTLADQVSRMQFGRPSKWISLYEHNLVTRGLMDTASADNIVTDSAAAGSSWGCGVRIPNGRINIGPNGEIYTPIFTHFRNAGKKTGLVTTTRLTHATPSSFVANVPSRNNEDDIAVQMLEREPDVLLGGGNRFFSADMRQDGRDLYTEFASKGYAVARTKAEMMDSASSKIIGVFDNEHLPYTTDHLHIPALKENVPTIAEMTKLALDKLSGSSGFLLQVEGGRVDHAAHGNDAPGLIYDQIAFDDAVAVAIEFVNQNPDTLLIITTDHGNSNPGLNGYGDAARMLETVTRATRTNGYILSSFDDSTPLARIRETIENFSSIAITNEQAAMIRSAIRREYREAYDRMNGSSTVFSRIMSNYNGVSFNSTTHTSDHVELCAMGPGSEALAGYVLNTDLFKVMTQSAGVTI